MRIIVAKGIDIGDLPIADIVIEHSDINNVKKYDGCDDIEIVIATRAFAKEIAKISLPSLKLVQLTSAGYDNVPIELFKAKGVAVCNAGAVYSPAMAEMIVYGIMRMQKRYYKNPNYVFLRPLRGYKYISELGGKTAMIFTAGNIGAHTAKLLTAFGVKVYGYDKFVKEKEGFIEIINARDSLIDKLPECDFVISALPHMPDTEDFVDKELISAFKPDSVFVNVGRRKTINENDLYTALKNKSIRGAVLDIFEKLPNPITNKFRRLSNVIVFPGVTAISRETNQRLRDHITNNIRCVIEGGSPQCIINRE